MEHNKDKGTSVGFSKMTDKQKAEIVKISKQFASGFEETFPSINGTGWLIVDPLSGYLNHVGYENKLGEMPETSKHLQVLIITFNSGEQLIPAGADLKPLFIEAENWMWL